MLSREYHLPHDDSLTIERFQASRKTSCAYCGKRGLLTRRCGQCRKQFYCTNGCAKFHWRREHGEVCSFLRDPMRLEYPRRTNDESDSDDDEDGDLPPLSPIASLPPRQETTISPTKLRFQQEQKQGRLGARLESYRRISRPYRETLQKSGDQAALALSKEMRWRPSPKSQLQHAPTALALHQSMAARAAKRMINEQKVSLSSSIIPSQRGSGLTKLPSRELASGLLLPRAKLEVRWGSSYF